MGDISTLAAVLTAKSPRHHNCTRQRKGGCLTVAKRGKWASGFAALQETRLTHVYTSILDMIGDTPVLKTSKLDTGPCELYLKLESQNPAGSIKDRIGLNMIREAEAKGDLKPGQTIIEATAGNTGLGLALMACQSGYPIKIVMPDKMSREKILHLQALGAEVVLTRSDVEKGHPEYYQDLALKIAAEEGAWFVNQFANPDNPNTHFKTTGPESWQAMEGRIDAAVFGVGSGGTITGIGRYLKDQNPDCKIIVADPVGSVVAEVVRTGVVPTEIGSWLVEGIGEDFIPPNLDLSVIDEAEIVSDEEAFAAIRELALAEGVIGGSSTGTLLAGALSWCRKQTKPKRVLTLVPDTGNKYLGKAFNEGWLIDNNLLPREHTGTILDLVTRRADKGGVVSVTSTDTLDTAYKRMRMFDISQLPVMDDGTLSGIIDESDVLVNIGEGTLGFDAPVSEIMVTRLEILPPDASFDKVIGLLRAEKVAIVADVTTFFGLITKVDVISHLRQQLDS